MLLMSFMKPWKDPDALGQRNQLDFVLDFFLFPDPEVFSAYSLCE